MKVISINVSGLDRAVKSGLLQWMARQDADLFCLNNINIGYPALDEPEYILDGYYEYFFACGDSGKGGVAIYTRVLPKAIIHGLGFSECDHDGRYMQADFDRYSVGSICFPGTIGSDEDRAKHKAFAEHYQACLVKQSRKRRPFFVTGYFGMAHTWRDVSDPDDMTALPGFLIEEQTWFDDTLQETGLVDIHREFDPEGFFTTETDAEGRQWRTDYLFGSEILIDCIQSVSIMDAPAPGCTGHPLVAVIDDTP
jgi:exodeoxyribonuclease-3